MRSMSLATALAAAAAGLPVAAPAVAHDVHHAQSARSSFDISIHQSTTKVTVGRRVVFTGQVAPVGAASGRFVRLEERFAPGKPWRLDSRAKVGPEGGYRLGDKPTVNTRHAYRVVMLAGAGQARGVSQVVRVKVYGWVDLADQRRVNYSGVYEPRTVLMNGVGYQPGIASYRGGTRPAHIEYELGYRCTMLRATFGLDDTSEIDGRSHLVVRTEKGELYSHSFGVGETDSTTLDLGSALKIRLEMTSLVPGVQGYSAAGAAQVLCVR